MSWIYRSSSVLTTQALRPSTSEMLHYGFKLTGQHSAPLPLRALEENATRQGIRGVLVPAARQKADAADYRNISSGHRDRVDFGHHHRGVDDRGPAERRST